jgi:hypothetical protein
MPAKKKATFLQENTPPSKRAKGGSFASETPLSSSCASTSATSSAGNMEALAATAESHLSNGVYTKELQDALTNILMSYPYQLLTVIGIHDGDVEAER